MFFRVIPGPGYANRGQQLAALALAAAGGMLSLAEQAGGQSPPQFRSPADVRPRIADEHDRPYFRETQSHRGWEIREPQFTVFAATSAADARDAAAHVAEGWSNAMALSKRWTDVASNPDFGLSALQVAIDNEPLRERDGPLTTVNVVGIRTQVQINVAPGMPSLQQQLVSLREGAAFAALHAAGLDSAAPPWVVAGLASFAGREGLPAEQIERSSARAAGSQFGGQQWRFARSSDDTLDYRQIDQQQSADQVAFLLTGNDAEHAPAFVEALQEATSSTAAAAASGSAFQPLPGSTQLAATDSRCDRLIAQLAGPYSAWRENRLAGQPVFEPDKDASAELLAIEKEMLVLLKLQRRLETSGMQDAGASAALSAGAVRTKVVVFDPAKGASVAAAKQRAPVRTFAELAGRLTDPKRPAWGTLDVDGSLLLSSDARRVDELVGGFDQPYSIDYTDRAVLVRRLEGQREIRGWLEENPKDKTRPVAKFEVVDLRGKSKLNDTRKEARQARRVSNDEGRSFLALTPALSQRERE